MLGLWLANDIIEHTVDLHVQADYGPEEPKQIDK